MLLKKITGAAFVSMVGMVLTIILGVVLARTMGVEAYGQYSFIISVATLVSLPLLAGLPTLVVREVAAFQALNDQGSLKQLWQFVVYVLTVGCICVCFGLWVYTGITMLSALAGFTLLVLVQIILFNTEQVFSAFLRGGGYIVWALAPKQIFRPCLLLVACYGVHITDGELNAHFAVGLNLVALTIVCIALFVGICVAFRVFSQDGGSAQIDTRAMLISLIPLTLYGGMSIANTEILTVMLGGLGSVSDVGLYKVAMAISGVAALGLSVINLVLAPQFSSAFTTGDNTRVQKTIVFGGWVALAGAILIALVVFSFGEDLISLIFGNGYTEATLLAEIAVIAQLCNVAAGSPALLLNMAGKEKYTAKGMLIALLLTFICGLLFIPSYGSVGACVAFMVSMISWNIVLAIMVYKKLGLQSSPLLGWLNIK